MITDVINANQSILVVKEPISTKGPRIAQSYLLPAVYCFGSFFDRVSISQKNRRQKKKRQT
jgi:Ribonuclease G/E